MSTIDRPIPMQPANAGGVSSLPAGAGPASRRGTDRQPSIVHGGSDPWMGLDKRGSPGQPDPVGPSRNDVPDSLYEKRLPETWRVGADYRQNDYVQYDGGVYRAVQDIKTPPLPGPGDNPDFKPIYKTRDPELLKRGSIQDQLRQGVAGPIFVSPDDNVPDNAYDPGRAYQKGDIVGVGDVHYVATKPSGPMSVPKRAPAWDLPPDRNPNFAKMDSTQPPGNTLSTVIRDGKAEEMPFSQRVEQSMQRSVDYLQKAIEKLQTFERQSWDDSLKQQMENLFPGITASRAGRDILKSELSIQLARMQETVKAGYKDISMHHEFDHIGSDLYGSLGFADGHFVHLNVDRLKDASDRTLDETVLHEFSHLTLLSKDHSYLNGQKNEADLASSFPHWQWGNAESLALGVMALNGKPRDGAA